MQYTQFVSHLIEELTGQPILASEVFFGHSVAQLADGTIVIDRQRTDFCSLEEAKDYIQQQRLVEQVEEQLQQEQHADVSAEKIVSVIRQHHGNIRVTDTLVESYVELACSRAFTLDPVAYDLRSFNQLANALPGFVDFRLNDGTSVAVREETYHLINKVFGQHADVISYMQESRDNFISVVGQLEE